METNTIESAFLEIRKGQNELMRKIDRISYTVGILPEYEKEWLNSHDVCEILNISYRTLLRLKAAGEISCYTAGRRCLYNRSEVEKFIRNNHKYSLKQ